MSLKAKFFLSDEGFGHIARQKQIIDIFKINDPNFIAEIQTRDHLGFAKKIISADNFIDEHNLIIWMKNDDGSPNLDAIRSYYLDYIEKSKKLINIEFNENKHDFYVSDFVYEAFKIASINKKPSFGVAHFTWDWFFSKIYPTPIQDKLIKYFFDCAQEASILFFPPYTPKEILNHYSKNAISIPFIVNKNINSVKWANSQGSKNILVMDSGTRIMKKLIENAFNNCDSFGNDYFFASRYNLKINNYLKIPESKMLLDYIEDAD